MVVTIRDGLLRTALVFAVAAFIAACVRSKWLRLAVFLLGAGALVSSNWGSATDYALQYAVQLFLLGVLVAGVRWDYYSPVNEANSLTLQPIVGPGGPVASLLDPRPIWATTAENGHPDFFSEASVPVVDTGLSP